MRNTARNDIRLGYTVIESSSIITDHEPNALADDEAELICSLRLSSYNPLSRCLKDINSLLLLPVLA